LAFEQVEYSKRCLENLKKPLKIQIKQKSQKLYEAEKTL
jgi:hypothetical protein